MQRLWIVGLALCALSCERGVDAVLSIDVEGPSVADVRAIELELDLQTQSKLVFAASGALAFPKRLDVTFAPGQASAGTATVTACDQLTARLLRGSQQVEVRSGQATRLRIGLTLDVASRCSDVQRPDGGVGGGHAGAGGAGGGSGGAGHGGSGGGAGHGGSGGSAGLPADGGTRPDAGATSDGSPPAGDGPQAACDPILPAATMGCPAGQGCYLGSGDEPACRPAGTGTLNAPCGSANDCAPGLVCYRSSSDTAYQCGLLCRVWFDSNDPTGLTSNCPPNPLLPFPVALLCKTFSDSTYGACL